MKLNFNGCSNSKYLIVLTILLSMLSCSKSDRKTDDIFSKVPSFPIPPAMYVSPESRAEYILVHLWDEVKSLDTVSFNSISERERFIVDFFAISALASDSAIEKSYEIFFDKASDSLDSVSIQYAEHYLNDPNSPIYDQELYYIIMGVAKKNNLLNEADELRYKEGYNLYMKNKVGDQAQDFEYITPAGKKMSLYKTECFDYLLLMFYNPDCHTCEQYFEYLNNSETVDTAIRTKKLSILCIYADDDEELWRSALNKVPSFASVGMDLNMSIIKSSIYDLKVSPTLYLLDKDKKVVLKDLFPDQLEEYLSKSNIK